MTAAAKLDVVAGNAPAPTPAAKPATPSQEMLTKAGLQSVQMLTKAGLQSVREPSLSEEMDDSVKF
jgi:hypothetical protein